MARIYDSEVEAELVATIAAKAEESTKIREQMTAMQDETPKDKWNADQNTRYAMLMSDLRFVEEEKDRADNKLADMLFHKPDSSGPEDGSFEDVLERVMRRGKVGATQDELDRLADELNAEGMASTDPKPGDTHGMLVRAGISPRQMRHRMQIAQMTGGRVYGAVTSDSDSGSNFIDTDTLPTVVDTLAQYGGAMEVCGRLASSSSAPVRIPQENAASQKGVCLSSQGSTAADLQTPNPEFVEFKNYTFHSNWVEITNEMIDDAGFDIVGWVMSQLQRRLGRIMNEKFTIGNGTNEPTGFMQAPKEFTVTGATTLSFPDDFIDLMYEVDEAYLQGEKGVGGLPSGSGMANRDGIIGFTFNRKTEGYLRKAKDSDGRPLWQPGITLDKPDMILGYPYVTNNDIAEIATGAKTVVFGNLGNHKIRLQDSIALWNFWDSATATRNARRIIGYSRADSNNVMAKISSKWPSHATIKQA